MVAHDTADRDRRHRGHAGQRLVRDDVVLPRRGLCDRVGRQFDPHGAVERIGLGPGDGSCRSRRERAQPLRRVLHERHLLPGCRWRGRRLGRSHRPAVERLHVERPDDRPSVEREQRCTPRARRARPLRSAWPSVPAPTASTSFPWRTRGTGRHGPRQRFPPPVPSSSLPTCPAPGCPSAPPRRAIPARSIRS